jgi:hypothetical protein
MATGETFLSEPRQSMLQDLSEITQSDGLDTLYAYGATVSTLLPFLNPAVPWVWLLGHRPHRIIEWAHATLPLDALGNTVSAQARSVAYDLLLPTGQFVGFAPHLEEHGMVLIQSHKPMPDSLELGRVPEPQLANVLRSNGAFLRIFLPHAVETAQVQCFEPGYLARWVSKQTSPRN